MDSTNHKAKDYKMVKSALVGFCYPCQSAHIKEETVRENGELYCRRTGSLIYATDGMKPPIPIEVSQKDLDEIEEKYQSEEKGENEKLELPSRTEQIVEALESIALMYDVDIVQHDVTWKSIVDQFLEIANVKKTVVTHLGVMRKVK